MGGVGVGLVDVVGGVGVGTGINGEGFVGVVGLGLADTERRMNNHQKSK